MNLKNLQRLESNKRSEVGNSANLVAVYGQEVDVGGSSEMLQIFASDSILEKFLLIIGELKNYKVSECWEVLETLETAVVHGKVLKVFACFYQFFDSRGQLVDGDVIEA